MIDRENVIKESEEAIDILSKIDEPTFYVDFVRCAFENALNLLKKQEAVKPILIHEGWNKYHNDYVCPRCDNEVFYEQNYCSECGVEFMWKG